MVNLGKISKIKLFADGYKLLRESDIWLPSEQRTVRCIKVCERDGIWTLYGKYETKKERDNVMRELITAKGSKYIVEDI